MELNELSIYLKDIYIQDEFYSYILREINTSLYP